MKILSLAIALPLLTANLAHAESIWLTGAKAEAIVQPLIEAGAEPLATHTYFNVGTVACAKLFDDRGDYFPGGKIGDYVGEECSFWGNADDSDADGHSERQILIPQNDRELGHSPDVRAKLDLARRIREGLEAIVQPIVRTTNQNGQTIVIAQTSGIGGMACDGYNAAHQRVCQVLLSPKCPARK